MLFIVFVVLFVGLCGWLDARIDAPHVKGAK
jgi:hypothetical protein